MDRTYGEYMNKNITARDVTVPATSAALPGVGVDRHEVTDRSAFAELDAALAEVAKRNAVEFARQDAERDQQEGK